ncbi:hypothetical protein [Streptomyces sp. NBC_01233]|uniref:hypothetical protein n=1 Tax=Streptomyces sp. NBC_01233 TaxID=2903787 RepID=UPI002E13ED8B|nr:hypothetical protein OG332_19045 [Streptomyces sp. NBC_01233]
MAETFTYRFMSGGVGLAANITAAAAEVDSPPPHALRIYGNVHLRLPASGLHWKDAAWLAFGMSLHTDELAERRPGSDHLVLDVASLVYPIADYRAEVAALAIDGWIHQNLHLPPCGSAVRYDRSDHRFTFDWVGVDSPFADDWPPLSP